MMLSRRRTENGLDGFMATLDARLVKVREYIEAVRRAHN